MAVRHHQRLLHRLVLAVIALGIGTALIWHHIEDITHPWVPARPLNTARIERGVVIPTVQLSDLKYLKKEKDLLATHDYFIYCMGRSRKPECHYPKTKHGREAAAYLTYLVDYYDALPKYSVFIHSIDQQWHNDVLGLWTQPALRKFRYEAVDTLGYANLRCTQDPGCPLALEPLKPSGHDIATNDVRARFADIYKHLFNVSRADIPKVIGSTCCAQFVVTREQIRKRPKEDYARMLQWLADNTIDNPRDQGWLFEITWHIIFGMEPIHCPSEEQCRCDLYGWCGPFTGSGEVLKAAGG